MKFSDIVWGNWRVTAAPRSADRKESGNFFQNIYVKHKYQVQFHYDHADS